MIIKDVNPLSIAKIEVEKLFGIYNYILPNESPSDLSKLMIIYGDNGTGKTTIVQLCFYLLSTKNGSGYKSLLAQMKFKKFCVHFHNGLEIGVYRAKSIIGTYEYYIKKNNKKIKSLLLKTNNLPSYDITIGVKDHEKLASIYNYLNKLNITVFYLTDERKLLNSVTSTNIKEESEVRRIYREKLPTQSSIIRPSIEKLNKWVRSKVLAGSMIGEKNSQAIFSEIIKNYINLSETELIIKDKATILQDLKILEEKMPPYIKLGLIESIDSRTIRNSINRAKTTEQIKYLSTVISPFIEGINAKLVALAIVERILNLFIKTVNDFFSNKTISFNLNSGFNLTQNNGEDLSFKWLSSGERQLLFLLINTITSADDATVFIIDEPEISLNIKWQRKLIKTLLAFSNDKKIQFILSTHSFEVLSGNMTNTTKLINNA